MYFAADEVWIGGKQREVIIFCNRAQNSDAVCVKDTGTVFFSIPKMKRLDKFERFQ